MDVHAAAARWLDENGTGPSTPGWDRRAYLDASERLTRACAAFQRDDGTLRDPWTDTLGEAGERLSPTWMVLHSYAGTARYVGAVARLVRAGRARDLVESAARALDWNARTLWEGREAHRPGAEFEMIELVDGLTALGPLVEPARAARWRVWLGGIDPELAYGDVFAERPGPRNGNTFGIASEQARLNAGLAGSEVFIDRYLEYQKQWFTPAGMYLDPGAPLVYDLTVRKNLVLLMARGYRGRHAGWVEETLERGGLVSLFTQTAAGQVCFGGRSSQYLFVEATLACVLEYEARRYATQGRARLAGAFARAARLALESTESWAAMDPPRHIRNGFPIERAHGIDSYGLYTVYAPLAATLFAEAFALADPGIPTFPCPAETGVSVFTLDPVFHKTFAHINGWTAVVDTAGDPEYDATGLGLLHRRGLAAPLVLSSPLPARPRYRSAVAVSGEPAAIGPAWREPDGAWRSLASMTADQIESCETATETRPGETVVETRWRLRAPPRRVTVAVRLREDAVVVRAEVEGATAIRLLLPVLVSDGGVAPVVETRGDTVSCALGACLLAARVDGVAAEWAEGVLANRNGVYRLACWAGRGAAIECRIEVTRR